jgi:hypothetical protein
LYGDTDGVLDAERLAEFIKERPGEPGVSTESDADFGKLSLKSRDDA